MYPLNEPAFDRLVYYRETTSVGKSQKIKPMTKRAKNIAINKLIEYPENIQSSMVTKCIKNNWETVWPMGGTLEYDDKSVEKASYPQPPEIIQEQLDKINKAVPKETINPLEQLYGTSKEDKSKIAEQERKRIKEMFK